MNYTVQYSTSSHLLAFEMERNSYHQRTQTEQLLPMIIGPQWIMVVILMVGVFCFTMKRVFNTFSVFTAYKNVCENDKLRKKYMAHFETRENLLYHIGSAKAHGELDLARRLMKDLDEVDKVNLCIFSLLCRMI